MAKKLSTRTVIKRLRSEGYSRKALAGMFGVSVSSIGRAERGETSGGTVAAPAREFYGLGKRAKANVVSGSIPLPSAKPKPAPKAETIIEKVVLSPFEKTELKLKEMYDNDKVVFYIHLKGKTIPLGAHGGIKVSTVLKAPSLEDFLAVQGGDQGYKIDWSEVVSIDHEEYY
jgi:transcriptional regulator with XRE-family HTH domain